jgi:hypothetical protein
MHGAVTTVLASAPSLALFSELATQTARVAAPFAAAAGLRVHLSNGLYANAVFDRLAGNWSTRTPS